jgi:hypothetical protein
MTPRLALLLIPLLGGCATRLVYAGPAYAEPAVEHIPLVVGLEQTPCFGTCPVYAVSVWRDGRATYDGRAHVTQIGTREHSVSASTLLALDEAIERAHVETLATSYEQRFVTDLPTTITTVTDRHGRTKRIRRYHGDRTAPARLVQLERDIARILGLDRGLTRGPRVEITGVYVPHVIVAAGAHDEPCDDSAHDHGGRHDDRGHDDHDRGHDGHGRSSDDHDRGHDDHDGEATRPVQPPREPRAPSSTVVVVVPSPHAPAPPAPRSSAPAMSPRPERTPRATDGIEPARPGRTWTPTPVRPVDASPVELTPAPRWSEDDERTPRATGDVELARPGRQWSPAPARPSTPTPTVSRAPAPWAPARSPSATPDRPALPAPTAALPERTPSVTRGSSGWSPARVPQASTPRATLPTPRPSDTPRSTPAPTMSRGGSASRDLAVPSAPVKKASIDREAKKLEVRPLPRKSLESPVIGR